MLRLRTIFYSFTRFALGKGKSQLHRLHAAVHLLKHKTLAIDAFVAELQVPLKSLILLLQLLNLMYKLNGLTLFLLLKIFFGRLFNDDIVSALS